MVLFQYIPLRPHQLRRRLPPAIPPYQLLFPLKRIEPAQIRFEARIEFVRDRAGGWTRQEFAGGFPAHLRGTDGCDKSGEPAESACNIAKGRVEVGWR